MDKKLHFVQEKAYKLSPPRRSLLLDSLPAHQGFFFCCCFYWRGQQFSELEQHVNHINFSAVHQLNRVTTFNQQDTKQRGKHFA